MTKSNRTIMNLIICISEILIGVLLLIDPVGFTSAVLMILGIALMILGAWKTVSYFRTSPEAAAQNGGLVVGIVCVLLGAFCVFRWEWFLVTFPVLTVVYGVITLINGINKVQWAVDLLRLKQRFWFVSLIGAALTLVFGILILTNPFTTTAILWTFIAVTLIAEAALDIVTFILARK